jgi:hypothetical protein
LIVVLIAVQQAEAEAEAESEAAEVDVSDTSSHDESMGYDDEDNTYMRELQAARGIQLPSDHLEPMSEQEFGPLDDADLPVFDGFDAMNVFQSLLSADLGSCTVISAHPTGGYVVSDSLVALIVGKRFK